MSAEQAEEFGAAMTALDERARKFVVLRVWHGKNPTQAAKGAGYGAKSDGYLRVQGHRLMRQDRVIAALKEEAERRLGSATAMALVGLSEAVESKQAKLRMPAIDSVLDRAGYGRKTTQDIRVEHVDNRSTAELMAAARLMLPQALPIVDTTAETVDAGS
jgi:phage terminase small subunit